MNYEPNNIRWRKGDIVLHDADAKEPRMFMRVIGYTRDGLCKTQYVDKSHKRTIYTNDIKYLHSLSQFGLSEISRDADYFAIKIWNLRYPVGTEVYVKLDSGEIKQTRTRSTAQFLGPYAAIWLEDVRGAYMLRCVWALCSRPDGFAGDAGDLEHWFNTCDRWADSP